MNLGVVPRQFNSYGSRRGNDAVMARGTFANIRLVNKLAAKTGPQTLHVPSGKPLINFPIKNRDYLHFTIFKAKWDCKFTNNNLIGFKTPFLISFLADGWIRTLV